MFFPGDGQPVGNLNRRFYSHSLNLLHGGENQAGQKDYRWKGQEKRTGAFKE